MNVEIQATEAIRKAAEVQETVETAGWKHIIDIINGLVERELASLMTQRLDSSYYNKIGMIQAMRYIMELDTVIKDAEVRNFLLHQGRALGLEILKKAPQFFFDGRQQGQAMIQKINGGESELDLKKRFTEDVYKKS